MPQFVVKNAVSFTLNAFEQHGSLDRYLANSYKRQSMDTGSLACSVDILRLAYLKRRSRQS